MNWGDDNATTCQSESVKPSCSADPLRRKGMSALASIVDKPRRVLEEHDQVVITIHLDWRRGKLRETIMGVPFKRDQSS